MRKVVVMGGGTGTFTILTGLKKYPLDLTALVAMSDDGGSTGILRDELGVLPPGDVRQCLVALSRETKLMRELINYRFEKGTLRGHNFGNLLLSGLEKITGSFDKAVEKASEILRIEGHVVPATLKKVKLIAALSNGKKLTGEHNIYEANLTKLKKIYLRPHAKANPKAVRAIKEADVVVFAPGHFYSSIIPNLLVQGISQEICKSKAKKIFICNLMTKHGQTDTFTVYNFVDKIKQFLGCDFDYVIYNNKRPSGWLLKRYAREKEHMVPTVLKKQKRVYNEKFIGGNLLNQKITTPRYPDLLKRNLIRHNPEVTARLIMKILKE